MADYSVFIKPSAAKELEALPPNDLERVISRIQALTTDPRPSGCVKISGQERYRIRQGDYRIVHSVDDDQRSVLVVKIGHRKEPAPSILGSYPSVRTPGLDPAAGASPAPNPRPSAQVEAFLRGHGPEPA